MFFKKKPKLKDLKLGSRFVKIEKTKKKRLPYEQRTWQQLYKEADILFAKAVKRKADKGFFCECFTCGRRMSYDPDRGNIHLHAGHWQARESWEIRYEFDNCRPQCSFCNSHREGRKSIFEKNLILEIGTERIEELKAISHRVNVQDRDYLIAKIHELKAFLKQK